MNELLLNHQTGTVENFRLSYLVGEYVQEKAVFVPYETTGHHVKLRAVVSLCGGVIHAGPLFYTLRSLKTGNSVLLFVAAT
jgi:hypothetical protein